MQFQIPHVQLTSLLEAYFTLLANHAEMKATATVNFQDLLDGLEWVSAGGRYKNPAWVSRLTGQIHCSSTMDDFGEVLPDDIDDDRIYVEIPHKHDLDLGNALALEFVEEHVPQEYESASRMFRKRGAYAQFKNLLERHKKLQAWYDYRSNAEEAALRQWCADNDIPLES